MLPGRRTLVATAETPSATTFRPPRSIPASPRDHETAAPDTSFRHFHIAPQRFFRSLPSARSGISSTRNFADARREAALFRSIHLVVDFAQLARYRTTQRDRIPFAKLP